MFSYYNVVEHYNRKTSSLSNVVINWWLIESSKIFKEKCDIRAKESWRNFFPFIVWWGSQGMRLCEQWSATNSFPWIVLIGSSVAPRRRLNARYYRYTFRYSHLKSYSFRFAGVIWFVTCRDIILYFFFLESKQII